MVKACPNGAEPTPSAAGLQVWIDRSKLPLDILSLLERLSPLGLAAIAVSMVDVDSLCAENMDVPEPFTAEDFAQQSVWGMPPFNVVNPAVVQKAYAWLRYGEFLLNCQCKLPAPPPSSACPYSSAAFNLAVGAASPPVAYSIPTDIYSTWPVTGTPPNQDWQPVFDASFTNHSPATTQRFVEWSSDQVTWHPFIELQNTATWQHPCAAGAVFLPPPRMPQSGHVRVHNNSTSTLALSGFSLCLCALTSVPPPIPVQPPITTAPDAPAIVCSPEDLCRMATETLLHLERVALQLSDLQAALTGRSAYVELGRQDITGEGETAFVLGTRAVSLELTALSGDAFTSALGRPRGLMRVGSIRYGDGIGYSPRRFIDADRFDDPLPPGALTISWQLLPDATAVLKFLG